MNAHYIDLIIIVGSRKLHSEAVYYFVSEFNLDYQVIVDIIERK